MRIWDLPAGYLNRQSLLGEHRELHGIHSIVAKGKVGYSRHPETLRWSHALSGLVCRHQQLAAEMDLRGYQDRSPFPVTARAARWPESFVTNPGDQIVVLRQKYVGKEKGRIALPRNAQELWAQHKYSVLARNPKTYQSLGRRVARMSRPGELNALVQDLVWILRDRPSHGRLVNAIEHMWGHVEGLATQDERATAFASVTQLFDHTQRLALRFRNKYLLSSTALSELGVFLGESGN